MWNKLYTYLWKNKYFYEYSYFMEPNLLESLIEEKEIFFMN